jgi:hypothetical protein
MLVARHDGGFRRNTDVDGAGQRLDGVAENAAPVVLEPGEESRVAE